MSGNKTKYSLRPATEADYQWLRELHHVAMRDAVERMWGWNETVQDAYFRASFDASKRQIVQVEGEDVGVIGVECRSDALFLADIQIAPAHQGKGIGTALIEDVKIQAHTDGLAVTLQVIRTNRARSLYERLGFEITEETPTHYRMRWTPSAMDSGLTPS